MILEINNEPTEFDSNITVSELLARRDEGELGIAVAVNDKIVRRTDWADFKLNDGDKVIIIKAAYGG
jgi:sulfur carrier protein